MDYPKNIRGTFAIQTALRGASVQPDWNDIKNKPTIYIKPSGGIPATDLNKDVVNALNKANNAVQPSDLQTAIANAITSTLNTPV